MLIDQTIDKKYVPNFYKKADTSKCMLTLLNNFLVHSYKKNNTLLKNCREIL